MYIHTFDSSFIKLKVSKFLSDYINENDIIELNIDGKLYSARVDMKNAKYIYVNLIGEMEQINELLFVQKL